MLISPSSQLENKKKDFLDNLQRVLLAQQAHKLSAKSIEILRRTLDLISNQPINWSMELIENCVNMVKKNQGILDEVDIKILELHCKLIFLLRSCHHVLVYNLHKTNLIFSEDTI